jgi:hypothetical protein
MVQYHNTFQKIMKFHLKQFLSFNIINVNRMILQTFFPTLVKLIDEFCPLFYFIFYLFCKELEESQNVWIKIVRLSLGSRRKKKDQRKQVVTRLVAQ